MLDTGKPYGSLVLIGTDPVSDPLLLLSDLAVHSENISRSPEVSLLVSELPANVDPLTQARITLQGQLVKESRPTSLRRYLRRYPTAEQFAGFTDFHLYRLVVDRAHLVGGFGNIHWIDSDQIGLKHHFLCEEGSEIDIINHMNEDHANAVQDIAATSKSKDTVKSWHMIGLDPEGFDLRSGWDFQRVPFENIVSNANNIRKEFVSMVKNARN